MKQTFAFLFLLTVMLSCKKEFNSSGSNDYLQNVKDGLKDSISTTDFSNLDFSKAVLSQVDSNTLYLLRVPFREKEIKNDFVLIKTNAAGKINKGKIVHLEGSESEFGSGIIKRRRWDGKIIISSLDRKAVLNSAITDGYIEAFHTQNLRASNLANPNELPEVIVMAYVHNSGISFSDWMYLQSVLGDNGSGGNSYSGYYSSMSGTGGGGSSNTGNGNGNPSGYGSGVTLDPPMHIDIETYVDHPAIDIEKYLKCFDDIPDAGAKCSIEIFADLPVDNNPYKLFELSTQSPGHTFIQIKKSNNGQYALQNIGFYPKLNWQSILTTAPVDGKFVDDGNHEFQASLKMNLSPEDFKSTITEIRYLARFIKYDVDEYNCTDFAMDVFNKTRIPSLDIPMVDIPGGMTAGGTRTPQGLYLKLQQMKNNGGPEAKNITADNYKHYVANSDGPCN